MRKETFKNLDYISSVKHAEKNGDKCNNFRGNLNYSF